jgi:DNA polymerase-3 subunit alpha
MKIDAFGRCFRSEQEIIDLLSQGDLDIAKAIKNPEDISAYNSTIDKYYLDLDKALEYASEINLTDYHNKCQDSWLMPQKYKEMDIVEWVVRQCNTDEELNRVEYELTLFEERNLSPVLCYLKYLVDVMRKNNIVWGVGRGSCTASYVLYKIGIHKIDSIKYELDIGEFLKL